MLWSCRFPGFHLLLVLVLTGAWQSALAIHPRVEVGFNGFVKNDCWFPVTVERVSGVRDCTILVMESQ